MEAKLHAPGASAAGGTAPSTCYEQFWGAQLRPSVDRPARRRGAPTRRARPRRRLRHGPRHAAGGGRPSGPHGRVLGHRPVAADGRRRSSERVPRPGSTNVDTEVVGAEDLGHDGEFDVALCSLGLMYVPDPRAALAEMHRAPAARRPRRRVGLGRAPRLRLGRDLPDRRRPRQLRRVPDVLRPRRTRRAAPTHRPRRVRRRRRRPTRRRARLRRRRRGRRRRVRRRAGRARRGRASTTSNARTRRTTSTSTRSPASPTAPGYRVPGEFVVATGRRP